MQILFIFKILNKQIIYIKNIKLLTLFRFGYNRNCYFNNAEISNHEIKVFFFFSFYASTFSKLNIQIKDFNAIKSHNIQAKNFISNCLNCSNI